MTAPGPPVSSPAQRLRSLAAAATIGADRAGGGAAAAAALLDELAALNLRARAGWRASRHPDHLAPPAEDTRPLAPLAAGATLLRILDMGDADLIEEWSRLALASGVRAESAAIPIALEWWSRQQKPSPIVLEMTGAIGAWLVSMNPDWRKPVATVEVPGGVDDTWSTGSFPERLAVLASVRRDDPAKARSLVESTWHDDGAAERKAFLDALFQNRSLADEPFLESALDDRSKQVRRQAAAILAATSGTRLRARMSERAAAIVQTTVRRGLLGRQHAKVSLKPPPQFDRAWERDGVEERPPDGVGPRAWWMRQILAAADLDVWERITSLDAEGVLGALDGDDYFGDALPALVQAASSSGNPQWGAALARRLMAMNPVDLEAIATLARGWSDASRERLGLELAGHGSLGLVERWGALAIVDRPWSEQFSASAMATLAAHARPDTADPWRLARAIDTVARLIAPRAADAFDDAVARAAGATPTDSFQRSIDRVRLRAEMHKEFTS